MSVRFSYKGSIIIILSIFLINILIATPLIKIGVNTKIAYVLVNTIFSSFIISYVNIFIDSDVKDWKEFLKRYLILAVIIAVFIQFF